MLSGAEAGSLWFWSSPRERDNMDFVYKPEKLDPSLAAAESEASSRTPVLSGHQFHYLEQ